MKLLLKGGTVVSAAGSKIADLLIEDEKIVRVGQDLTDAEATVVPMEGKLLFPGFIDAHTHFDLDVCNTTTADNFDTGTRSALRGGTTMVVDFRLPEQGRDAAIRPRPLAQKGRRPLELRLQLPHDDRRLERNHQI